jgi:hypothetical protein
MAPPQGQLFPRWPRFLLPPALLAAVAAACSSGPATGSSSASSSSASGAGGEASTSTGTGTTTTTSAAVSVGSGGSTPLPDKFTVTGVVTDGTNPLEGALVMQGGGKPLFTTGPDGAFSIELTSAIPAIPGVVASKLGYRTFAVEFLQLPDGPVTIPLRFVTPPDNIGYLFGDPGIGTTAHDNSTKFCGHCHTTLVAEFQTSMHARATRDPLVQDLYAGAAAAFATQAACAQAGGAWKTGIVPGSPQTTASRCYVGAGVLPDLNPGCGGPGELACDDPALAQKPQKFGRCADCHAPGIDGEAGGRNLHEATGIAFDNGNHCDVCHHIRDVDLSKPPGLGGALMLQRPRDHVDPSNPSSKIVQVMFGPLPDVSNSFMGGSLQPKFRSADLCGGCHEQKQEALVPGTSIDPARWPKGLPTHSTYSEWSASSYNGPGTPCQFCHMPKDDTGLKSTMDVTNETNAGIVFGYVRPPEDIRKHIFRDPLQGNPRLIDKAVLVGLEGAASAGQLHVTVKLKNAAAGHAIPTGEPMRSLLLVLHADACGKTLAPSDGMTLSDWGGAAAEGVVGAGVTVNGAQITWAAGALAAKQGSVVRAVRPTGMFDDYAGIGFFADPALTPAEKGIEIRTPIGEANVLSSAGGVIALDAPLALQPGDVLFVGEAQAWPPADGAASRALAGVAGYSFARTLVDAGGKRQTPHYRAVDMVSDNRIAPLATATTTHSFAVPLGCSSATVSAAVLYRPLPLGLSRERGWDAHDYVVATEATTIALP